MLLKIDEIVVAKDGESPLKQAFDKFDVEHAEWTAADYKRHAWTVDSKVLADLLLKDFVWRFEHRRNVVASAEGEQGSGKSLFLTYLALLLAKIFGRPFVLEKHLWFMPDELDRALQKAERRETYLKDEHRKGKAGYQSNLVEANLADYEDQFREPQINILYASVGLQNHSHFFCFECKNVAYDKNAFPTHIRAMLKTKSFITGELVWRGFVVFPVPHKDFIAKYDVRKKLHIKQLQAKYGNTFDPIPKEAELLLEKRGADLTKKNKDGRIVPIKSEMLELVVSEEIGTSKYTIHGYKLLLAKLRDLIVQTYAEHNLKADEENRRLYEAKREKKLEEIKAREKERLDIQREKIELKRREIELKEKAKKSGNGD